MKEKIEKQACDESKNETRGQINEIKCFPGTELFGKETVSCKGDSASEYLEVKDRVLKYIQPRHKWYPSIIKIEKVTNLALEQKWLKSKLKRFDPRPTVYKFHGTSADAIDTIVRQGFRLGAPGLYGIGVYFATDASKSAQRIYTKGSNQLLLCEVLLGRSKTVKRAVPWMTLQKLTALGYDSIFAPRNTKKYGGVRFDEFVVYDPFQAIPRYIIYFRCDKTQSKL